MKRVLILTVCVAVLATLYILDPTEHPLMPKCPVKLLTGLSCPGCGFQRALHAVLHGHLVQAVRFNYWMVFAFPYLILLIIEKWVLRGKWQQRAEHWLESSVVIYTYIITFFIWFVVRNIYDI